MLGHGAAPPHRRWANASLWAGAAWVVLAMLPVPMTTLLGLPFAGCALLAGWVAWRASRALGDRGAARRASVGMGLGCGGFVWLLGVYLVLGSALVLAAVAGLHTLIARTPIP